MLSGGCIHIPYGMIGAGLKGGSRGRQALVRRKHANRMVPKNDALGAEDQLAFCNE